MLKESFPNIPCLISALRIPTLASPLTAPVFEGLATAVPRDTTTAPPVEGCVCVVCVDTYETEVKTEVKKLISTNKRHSNIRFKIQH